MFFFNEKGIYLLKLKDFTAGFALFTLAHEYLVTSLVS